jgi:LPS-assembly lipoprotein
MTGRFALVLAPLLLAGCNLAPVYSGGSTGAVASQLAGIEVAAIPDKAGYLVRDRLQQRLGGGQIRYRLTVALDDRIDGFGVRGDNSIIRERRTLRARWQLQETGSEKVLIDTTAGSDAGIDVVRSEYATVAAENTALERLSTDIADQIVARLAVFARNGK